MKQNSLRVLFLSRFCFPHRGGVESHIAEVVARLKRRDVNFTLWVEMGESFDGVSSVILGPALEQGKWARWQWMWQHRHELATFDVIHVHDVAWWLLPVLPWVWRRFFITFHGWEGVFPVPAKFKFHRWVVAQLSRGTIHVGSWIQKWYWDSPSAVVYGAASIRPAAVAKKTKSIRPKQPLSVVFLGRLEAENELEKYLVLVRILKEKYHLTMTWVGDGTYRTRCRAYGYVTGMIADTGSYLRSADVVLSSSYLSMWDGCAHQNLVCSLYSNDLKRDYLKAFPARDFLVAESDPSVAAVKVSLRLERTTAEKTAIWKQTLAVLEQHTWDRIVEVYYHLWTTAS